MSGCTRTLRSFSHGFTLLEVMIALVVMALLGLMSWQAIDSALNSREHIRDVELRWQKLTRGIGLIESNLQQVAERGSTKAEAMPDFKLEQLAGGEQRLIFWRSDAAQGARLVGFRQDKDKSALQLLRWKYNVPLGEPIGENLVEGARNVRWSVLNANKEWQEIWPPQGAANPAGVPKGVRLEMDIDKVGHVQRYFSLR